MMKETIEHTILSPTATEKQITTFLNESKSVDFLGVCVAPFWVKLAKDILEDTPKKLITVVGFPIGYQLTASKLDETKRVIDLGVDEVDMVMNMNAWKSNMAETKIEIAKMAALTYKHEKILKVIIETAYLDDQELIACAKLCEEAGADFVKTSTGFAPKGADPRQIKLMREILSSHIGIKASGGIKTKEDAQRMLDAGANRIGTSNGINILTS